MNKLAMRRAWFQVHKWIGLLLAVLIIPISVTGSALVWHDAVDRLANPARYAVSGAALLGADAYVTAARARLKPEERIASLSMPDHGGPVTIAAAGPPPKGPGRPERTMVYLDPPTARVLEVSGSNSGLTRTLHVLHGSLMIPGLGRSIVGWIGVAMMLSAFTGLWLWWPTVGRWAKGLRWKRHRNTDTNLHYLTGFWVAIPLFILSLTGAWISFPGFFGALTGEGGGRGRGPDRAAMMRARPVAAPAHPVAEVLAKAAPLASGATVRQVSWPTDRSPDWTVAFAGEGAPSVKVADDTGQATAAAERQRGGVARLMRRLHDGTGMGILWQVLIFLGGIIPALLAITGIIMWWRARGWKADLAARKRARGSPGRVGGEPERRLRVVGLPPIGKKGSHVAIEDVQNRIKNTPGLGKSMAKWSALGAVVAIPVPVIGPVFGALAGATYAYMKKR